MHATDRLNNFLEQPTEPVSTIGSELLAAVVIHIIAGSTPVGFSRESIAPLDCKPLRSPLATPTVTSLFSPAENAAANQYNNCYTEKV